MRVNQRIELPAPWKPRPQMPYVETKGDKMKVIVIAINPEQSSVVPDVKQVISKDDEILLIKERSTIILIKRNIISYEEVYGFNEPRNR